MDIVGQKVLHKTLGCGEIISFEGKPQNNKKYITVAFAAKQIELPFPSSFAGYLEALDEKFKEHVLSELATNAPSIDSIISPQKTTNRKKINLPEEYIKSKTILNLGHFCGTNSKKIYSECCRDFGWNKSQQNNFGRQGALLYAKAATPEGYSPWFLSHHELTQTQGGSWSNVIDGDFIYEKWEDIKPGLFDDNTQRVVFVKLDSKYYFYGVFCVDSTELNEEYKYIKKYKRISKSYPISD